MAAGQTQAASALHDDIINFVQQLQCTELELKHREEAIKRLVAIVRAAHNHAAHVHVVIFGSHASGLAWHASDIDIMIEGICSSNVDGSYNPQERAKAIKAMRKLAGYLRGSRYFDDILVLTKPRVPIIKCRSRRGVLLDISYGTSCDRLEAASFLVEASQYAPVVPMVLVLRALLQQHRLDKVMSGGLSSWVVALMVVGFLVQRLRQDSASVQEAGWDVGVLLVDFMRLYGQSFDCSTQVVAIDAGGIVPRAMVDVVDVPYAPPAVVVLQPAVRSYTDDDQDNDENEQDGSSNNARGDPRVYVQDPVTGKLLGGESYNAAQALQLFRRAEAVLRGRLHDPGALRSVIEVEAMIRRSSRDHAQPAPDAPRRGSRGPPSPGRRPRSTPRAAPAPPERKQQSQPPLQRSNDDSNDAVAFDFLAGAGRRAQRRRRPPPPRQCLSARVARDVRYIC